MSSPAQCSVRYHDGGAGYDLSAEDLGDLYSALTSAPAGTIGRLLNKSTKAYIYQAVSLGSGVVLPHADYSDTSGQVSEGGPILPRIDWSAATPHQYGHVDTGATGASISLTAGHNITETSGTYSVWDASAGSWLVQNDAFTRSGDTLSGTTSITTQAGDLVFVDGISEFDTDVWLPGILMADTNGDPLEFAIQAAGVFVKNTLSARVSSLFGGLSDNQLFHRGIKWRAQFTSRAFSGAQEGGFTGMWDDTNEYMAGAGDLLPTATGAGRAWTVETQPDYSGANGNTGNQNNTFADTDWIWGSLTPDNGTSKSPLLTAWLETAGGVDPNSQHYAARVLTNFQTTEITHFGFGCASVDNAGTAEMVIPYTEICF